MLARTAPLHWMRLGTLSLTLSMAALAGTAQASAWPQPEGGGQVIISGAYNRLNVQGFDNLGRPSGTGTLQQFALQPYWEHGLTQRWTLGFSPRLQAAWMDQGAIRGSGYGLTEAAFFARYALWRGEGQAFSIQGGVFTPGFSSSAMPRVGERFASTEIRAAYGIGREIGGLNVFASLQAAYRLRFGSNADEIRLDATVGARPFENWMVFVQSLNTIGMRNGRASGTDFDVYRLGLTVAYQINARNSIMLGYSRDIAGRRVALGDAVTLGWMHNY